MNKSTCVFTLFIILALTICNPVYSKGMQYDIGDGRKIFMECSGSGLPVVMLLAGYPMRGDYGWNTPEPHSNKPTVFSEVSKFTTVCTYDRPGTIMVKGDNFAMSRSTAVRQPVNVVDQAADLAALINAAHIAKPFIIVAHSAGGLIARMYAFSHPQDVAGLILLDVTTEDLKDKWTRKEWTVFDYSMNIADPLLYKHKEFEWLDMDVSFYQMQKAMGRGNNRVKLNIPYTVVMTADKKPIVDGLIKSGTWPAWATQQMADEIVRKVLISQDELANAFIPAAKHITHTNSGHNIQQEQPELVINEIQAMVKAVRESGLTRGFR
jgi:pimeloyl-ACP methyl ester carboxylesterase